MEEKASILPRVNFVEAAGLSTGRSVVGTQDDFFPRWMTLSSSNCLLACKSICIKHAKAFHSFSPAWNKVHIVKLSLRKWNICSRNTFLFFFKPRSEIWTASASRQKPACAKSAAIDSYDSADVWRRTGSSRHITTCSRSLQRSWMIPTAVKLSQGSGSEDSKHHQQARLLEIKICWRRCGSRPSLWNAELVKHWKTFSLKFLQYTLVFEAI